ncbi:hypothetical protein IFM89_037108 [Coptis chinensis]|uniref:Glycosyltransferase n=1 Tax=Coptis chinensis TaxID=261450 RepID=A0A835LUA7_9MAGN|nr:hypothetical protein IFM89_037108 [Coptis chinensis]
MDRTSESLQLEVIFIPFLVPGHMIPMVNIARLFATHGINVTIITNNFGAIQFHKALTEELKSGHKITIHTLSEESATPQETKNVKNFLFSTGTLKSQVEQVITQRSPQCIVSDMFFPWTADIAIALGIPRLVFYGFSYLGHCGMEIVTTVPPYSEEPYVLPSIPDKIEFLRSQLPFNIRTPKEWYAFFNAIREADKKSFGVLVNSFYELEPGYPECYTKLTGTKTWHIGPLHHIIKRFNADKGDERRGEVITAGHSCLSWLNSKIKNSVLYMSFGSMAKFSSAQLLEIASGLEASGHPFIWVIKTTEGDETSLPEGFEERMTEEKKGLVIKGWALQMLILEHPAIGGFVTHCGWNSTMESITSGVPMITWPITADQFYNEKVVTKVLKIGVEVGVEEWREMTVEQSYFVTRDKIEKAVIRLMSVDEEAIERRKRAKEFGEMAKRAVEDGGSSYVDLVSLIDNLKTMQSSRK